MPGALSHFASIEYVAPASNHEWAARVEPARLAAQRARSEAENERLRSIQYAPELAYPPEVLEASKQANEDLKRITEHPGMTRPLSPPVHSPEWHEYTNRR